MRFANQSAFKPGGAARLDERYAECWSGPCGNPVASELVDVAAALAADSVSQVPTRAAPGMQRPNAPLAVMSSRV
jgi:hypothetical protein